ncbi:MAG: lipoyl synthase [Deltaproteobacteria bacterium]|nr:lipoyl synthase [Deltaproteobacteria bacterium]
MSDPKEFKRKIKLVELNEVMNILKRVGVHTICEEARCPNISDCMSKNRATFLIMGSGCTRGCRFCSVRHYSPEPLDPLEPENIKRAVLSLGIKFVVITSVSRDDLPFGGAYVYKEVVERLREIDDIKIELLIPDFNGDVNAYSIVSELDVDVLNHNIETVKSMYSKIRPEACYERSLALLNYFSRKGYFTKSGVIVGFGEKKEELVELFRDLSNSGVKMLTIGQYLRPSARNVRVEKYYTDEEFQELRDIAMDCGIKYVFSGRYVRSSYSAEEQYKGVSL